MSLKFEFLKDENIKTNVETENKDTLLSIYLMTNKEYDGGYDEYDALVVCAESKEDAVKIEPDYAWTKNIENIEVKLIGTATPDQKRGLILGSFNAG
jgi:hypothetical protein